MSKRKLYLKRITSILKKKNSFYTIKYGPYRRMWAVETNGDRFTFFENSLLYCRNFATDTHSVVSLNEVIRYIRDGY